ncbi:hypothetical protein HGRIS_014311 [Hohenbuehelia grisea]|uniref:Uncharacterized protein n=1 Tax=Hohenbuehelia grisea TaxID=104357 RepID=A0ABR3JT48_9AGAR
MYTASSVFLKTLAESGITHAFVNWGSDHPGLLEDLERQRVEACGGSRSSALRIVTCPNEMVALSAAQGFAQVTGKAAAVIVHVDVGTQAMAGVIHNVDRGQVPVLIYAGASPFATTRDTRGARNEFIMWLQDIPDQPAIVRQYMRCTTEIYSAKTVSQVVRRSLQISMSQPRGPVYLWARREVMEEEVPESMMKPSPDLHHWHTTEPSALSPTATRRIANALLSAENPLIITSHLGRNPSAVHLLVELSNLLAIPILSVTPSAVNVPFSHPYHLGYSYLYPGTMPDLEKSDIILVIDTDTPWVPMHYRPSATARVFVFDGGDPLKRTMGFAHVDNAEMICNADAAVALGQLITDLLEIDLNLRVKKGLAAIDFPAVMARGAALRERKMQTIRNLDLLEETWKDGSRIINGVAEPSIQCVRSTTSNVIGVLRRAIHDLTPSKGRQTLVLNESVSNFASVWEMRTETPGMHLTSGGSSLGWALGAAIGAIMGNTLLGNDEQHDLAVVIVGDGSFLFGVPGSAYWIAQKENTVSRFPGIPASLTLIIGCSPF